MTEEEFAEFLDRLIELKESGNVSLNDVKEVFFWTAKLLNSLGVDIAELSEFVDLSDSRTALSNLAALTAITLAITLSRG
jgi:arginase family enzyme